MKIDLILTRDYMIKKQIFDIFMVKQKKVKKTIIWCWDMMILT